jgi:hypothetical protein
VSRLTAGSKAGRTGRVHGAQADQGRADIADQLTGDAWSSALRRPTSSFDHVALDIEVATGVLDCRSRGAVTFDA